MGSKRFCAFTFAATVVALALTVTSARAASNAESLFHAGMSFYEEPTDGLLAQRGYFLHFQVEPRDGWFRPNYGAEVDWNRGATDSTILSQMHFGAEIVASSNYIRPVLGASGIFGWIYHSNTDNTYLGIAYGALLTAGGEIRLSEKEKNVSLRLITGWRFLKASPGGGLSSSDLNAVQVSVGMTF